MLKTERTIAGPEPVTLDEAKDFLRVDYDTDDVLITSIITQSRDIVEQFLSRSLVDSASTLLADCRHEMVLPYGPVTSVASVLDIDGVEVADWTWDGLTLKLKVTDTFTVLYDTAADEHPGLRLGLLETIAYLYENRGDTGSIGLILYYNKNLQPFRNKVWI